MGVSTVYFSVLEVGAVYVESVEEDEVDFGLFCGVWVFDPVLKHWRFNLCIFVLVIVFLLDLFLGDSSRDLG